MRGKIVVKKIADYIEEHLDEDLPLDKIAKDLNYSKYYIARIFAQETGVTIYKYIQGRRLTLAAQELVESKKPIVEIAYEAHYGSQQAFTLAFQQVYLCTPQVYRRNGIFYPAQPGIHMKSTKYCKGNFFAGIYCKAADFGYTCPANVFSSFENQGYARPAYNNGTQKNGGQIAGGRGHLITIFYTQKNISQGGKIVA
jgi:AraC-type DNA-binding domain-containing proteins